MNIYAVFITEDGRMPISVNPLMAREIVEADSPEQALIHAGVKVLDQPFAIAVQLDRERLLSLYIDLKDIFGE